LLFTFEQNDVQEPILGMVLIKILNKSRNEDLYDTNFRVACHTLCNNSLITLHRNTSLKLSWSLTHEGRKKAEIIYDRKLAE